MPTVYLGLGSNLGDRETYLTSAIEDISCMEGIHYKTSSSIYETEPVGLKSDVWFLNVVIEVETDIKPLDLLYICQSIEKKYGKKFERQENDPYESRTLDIDILFYDECLIHSKKLKIPHPRAHERSYVLTPMREIAPDFMHPLYGETMIFMRKLLFNPEEVKLYIKKEELKK